MATKTYKNVGTQIIFGHAPGETFSADLNEGTEDFYFKAGGLEAVDGVAPSEDVVLPPASGKGPITAAESLPKPSRGPVVPTE